jgi:retron-type reverse transcriptase
MEEVTGSANLNRAYKRVKANGGAAGVDGLSVTELRAWITSNRETLIASLLDGSYQPQPPAFARAGSGQGVGTPGAPLLPLRGRL